MNTASPLVRADIGRIRFDAAKALWLWGMIVPGVAVGLPSLTVRTALASFALAFLTLCVGHSVGLHRGVIHRTYEARPIVRGALAYLFVLSGLGGPLAWARLHAVRDYWQNRDDCPPYFAYDHSLARDFVLNLHYRFFPADDRADARLPPDVLGDRWLAFLEKTWALHVIALGLVVALAFGPRAAATVVCARTAIGILGHWFVGYAAHAWGERRFLVRGAKESGTNVWLLGVLSFGEGFHNNHHAFPRSARMGMRAAEIDLGFLVIRALARIGLVRDVRTAVVPTLTSASPRALRSARSSA
jgi:stearoyl-CoA desaturase (delta-9 desaturase)